MPHSHTVLEQRGGSALSSFRTSVYSSVLTMDMSWPPQSVTSHATCHGRIELSAQGAFHNGCACCCSRTMPYFAILAQPVTRVFNIYVIFLAMVEKFKQLPWPVLLSRWRGDRRLIPLLFLHVSHGEVAHQIVSPIPLNNTRAVVSHSHADNIARNCSPYKAGSCTRGNSPSTANDYSAGKGHF